MFNTRVLVTGAAILSTVAFLAIGWSLYNWESSSSVPRGFASDLGYYITQNMVSDGAAYPHGDLSDPLLAHRKIVIGHALNSNSSKEVVRKLLYLSGKDAEAPIDLYISTSGGWYDSAFTIIDTFNTINAPVNTICIGGCYSAGLLLLASGTGNRVALNNALFSAHVSYNYDSDLREYAKIPDRINPFLQLVTNLPDDWFPLDDDRHYYFTADEALEFGVIDEIRHHKQVASSVK